MPPVSVSCVTYPGFAPRTAYLLSTPRNVFSLEPSSGGFSTAAFAGVEAREGSLDVAVEFGCEALGAASELAAESAMAAEGSVRTAEGPRGCGWAVRGAGDSVRGCGKAQAAMAVG